MRTAGGLIAGRDEERPVLNTSHLVITAEGYVKMILKVWYRVRRTIMRLFAGLSVRVKHGPLRGKKLMLDSRRGFRYGTYEPEHTEAFCRLMPAGGVVFDLGAHLGYYTLIASESVGAEGRVVAFEPEPDNLRRLRRNLALNKTSNVQIVEACVGAQAGTASFLIGKTSRSGRMAEEGQLTVPVVSLDELVASGAYPPPDMVKMDIEGAEAQALEGARGLLVRHRPDILLSVHGREVGEACLSILADCGYTVEPLGGGPMTDACELIALPQKAS